MKKRRCLKHIGEMSDRLSITVENMEYRSIYRELGRKCGCKRRRAVPSASDGKGELHFAGKSGGLYVSGSSEELVENTKAVQRRKTMITIFNRKELIVTASMENRRKSGIFLPKPYAV